MTHDETERLRGRPGVAGPTLHAGEVGETRKAPRPASPRNTDDGHWVLDQKRRDRTDDAILEYSTERWGQVTADRWILPCGCHYLEGQLCPEGAELKARAARAANRLGELRRAGISILGDQQGIDADHVAALAWDDYRAHFDPAEDRREIRKRVLL